MAPRPTCGSLLSLGVEGGVYGGCWSPLAPLRPAAVLLGSWFQMWAACVSLPREAHVTGRWLSPESGRGTLLQAQGRLGDKPPAGLRGASRLPWVPAAASGEVSVAWGSPLLKSAWTLGDRAGGPPALSSGGAWGPHSEGRQGVWEATLVHQLCPALGISWRQTCAVGMVGHPGLACEHRGCHWAEGLALSSSGGVQGRLRARVVLTSWGQRVGVLGSGGLLSDD